MIDCTKATIEEVNYFLNLMGQKSITEEVFENKINNYVVINRIAFVAYSIYYDRAEIDYIYVIDKYRNNGYASRLMEYVITKTKNLENITLEVNVNNTEAINLYKKFGFKIVAKREKYYGSDDAYLMIRR